MIPKLTDELRAALGQRGGPIEVRDEHTQITYVLAERALFEKALQALQAQEDRAAIQEGIDDMIAGNVFTLEEVDEKIRAQLESL
jgi:predicted transcriptional regulator